MCDHDHEGLDWEDIVLAGSLAEEIFEAEREKERIRREMGEEQEEKMKRATRIFKTITPAAISPDR